jgi:hypothetical protein
MVSAFPVFKTLTLGLQKDHKSYRGALKAGGCNTGEYVDEIIENAPIARVLTEVHLVAVTTADLGFTAAARRDAIYARALERGLEICPAEIGPALRLAYRPAQPGKEMLNIAMQPVAVRSNYLGMLYLQNSDTGDPWLDSYDGASNWAWGSDCRWVFVTRQEEARVMEPAAGLLRRWCFGTDADYERYLSAVRESRCFEVSLVALTDLRLPESCIVCGATDPECKMPPTVKGHRALSGGNVSLPVCRQDFDKQRSLRTFRIAGGVLAFAGPVAALGLLTLRLTRGHMAAIWSYTLAVVVCSYGVYGALQLLRVLQLRFFGRPALVVREGMSYAGEKARIFSLEFANAEVAAAVRALNKESR